MKPLGDKRLLPPVRPNAGTEALYRRKLQALIREMNASVLYWIRAAYRANEPIIAKDELPSKALQRVIDRLSKRWRKNFDAAAAELAAYFAQRANQRVASQLTRILKERGFSVQFKMTQAMRDVMNAVIEENVGLIRTIPEQYFKAIQGDVMRSVQTGRDLGQLTKDLESNYGVSHRRAAFIARDQNNKMTGVMINARQREVGITEAIWLHSGGGKEPRPNHVKFGKEKARYDVTKGIYDPDADGKGKGRWIFPGQLINCRCVSRPVIPGFS